MKFVVEKKEIDVYEETENCGVGGEGDSSRAHGIPDGNIDYELHGTRAVLKREGDGNASSDHPALRAPLLTQEGK